MKIKKSLTRDSICGIELYQHKDGYRFSIDSILLAHFTRITKKTRNVIDLGAGSGIIGLILARRYGWISIDLIELQEGLYKLCLENIKINKLEDRVRVFRYDIARIHKGLCNELKPESVDIVVTNPPFRQPGTGRISPNDERAIARHEMALNLSDLFSSVRFVLRNRGRLFMIYHPFRLTEIISTMKEKQLELKRIRFVHPRKGREANMVLMEAVKMGSVELKVEPPLFIYENKNYSKEVNDIFEYFACKN
ncbi:MAG: tRNA1(Val) (adenine(37)-N6)-methyltransferase [Nitrospirae bacterium]|nr:tRNA1(Val) (adenine(37)-N6)-methyltransferase [Nitrospirota bacterium]